MQFTSNSLCATNTRFCKLGLQELYNVWRKRALASLQGEVHQSRGASGDISKFPRSYRSEGAHV